MNSLITLLLLEFGISSIQNQKKKREWKQKAILKHIAVHKSIDRTVFEF